MAQRLLAHIHSANVDARSNTRGRVLFSCYLLLFPRLLPCPGNEAGGEEAAAATFHTGGTRKGAKGTSAARTTSLPVGLEKKSC